jgi:hypothetical protein
MAGAMAGASIDLIEEGLIEASEFLRKINLEIESIAILLEMENPL